MFKSILFCVSLLVLSFGGKANTYYVTTVADTGVGSLRATMDSANTHSGLDTVLLLLGAHDTIYIGSPLPVIADSLVITGQPCQNPTIYGAPLLNGNTAGFTSSAFLCIGWYPVTFNYLNIFNCKNIRSGPGDAGAITAYQLYLNNCYFYGNSDSTGSGAAASANAGAVFSNYIWAYNSTFDHNYYATTFFLSLSGGEAAGALYTNNGYLYNCTFSGNGSFLNGGALYGDFYVIDNCTITGNSADTGGAIANTNPHPIINISNSIIWGNSCANHSDQWLVGAGYFGVGVNSGGCNILQSIGLVLTATDSMGTDPQLGTFGYYSGCVPIQPILCGSVAQNHATCTGATLTDAQGIPAQGIRDAGAFELTQPVLGGDTLDSIPHGSAASLYNYFNTTGYTIKWPAGLNDSSAAVVDTGTYTVIATNAFGCNDTATVTILYSTDTLGAGLQEVVLPGSFKMYPNPAKEITVLSWSTNKGDELQLRLNDMLGRVVLFDNISEAAGKYTIHTNAFNSGVYCIGITQGAKNIFSGKLVVLNH